MWLDTSDNLLKLSFTKGSAANSVSFVEGKNMIGLKSTRKYDEIVTASFIYYNKQRMYLWVGGGRINERIIF